MNNQGSLSKEEYKKLFREYNRTKDKQIRERLIENFLYIAEILARKYQGRGIEYDDIFQVASLGLIYAIDRFDVEKGFEFSSFATPTIIGEIKKYFRDKGWTIKVPRRVQELNKKINNARVELFQTLMRQPTVRDIADFLNISEEEVLEVMEAGKVYSPQSLDESYDGQNDDNEYALSDMVGSDDLKFERFENSDFLMKALNNLTPIEKQILIERYFEKETQINIANKLGISQMSVSRIEKKFLAKLRKELKKTMG